MASLKITLCVVLVLLVSIDRSNASIKNFNYKPKSNLKIFKEKKILQDVKVQYWIHYFKRKRKKTFINTIKRGMKYRLFIEEYLAKQNLPEDLFFVALIESGFSYNAISKSGAKGIWQFMKGTARDCGLIVNDKVDERLSVIKSTKAAAYYLKKLHKRFNSWELALTAYNVGPNRVHRLLKKHNVKSFKEFLKISELPFETRMYVPKIWAAKEVYGSLRKEGLIESSNRDVFNFANYSKWRVFFPISLPKLLEFSQIDKRKFIELSGHVNGKINSHFEVYLPRGVDLSKFRLNGQSS